MSDAPPLVTVVIPTWNRLPLLREAVASVVAQTYAAWELVIADDGSGDGTAAWVAELGDPRIRVSAAAHCGHLGRVRNRGAREGTGSLVAFLDSDDLWVPEKLALQVAALAESGAEWCYADFANVDAGRRPIAERGRDHGIRSGRVVREVLRFDVAVSVSTLFMRRTAFERVGGFSEDARLTFRGDHELALRLALDSAAVGLPQVVTLIRDHPARITATLADPHERTARVYELFLELRPPRDLARVARQMRGGLLSEAGGRALAGGRWTDAARYFARGVAGGARPRSLAAALVHGVRGLLRRRPRRVATPSASA